MGIFDKNKSSIDRLKANIDQGARANRFEVRIVCPYYKSEKLGIRCVDAQIPGRQFEVSDWSTYGPNIKYPYNVSNDNQEISFTFLCDSTFADRYLIDAWMAMIYTGDANVEAKQKALSEADAAGIGGDIPSGVGVANKFANSAHPMWAYYKHYTGQIEIVQFTRSEESSLIHTLYEAYPIAMNPMPLSASGGEDIMKFECTFAYRTWDSDYIAPNPVSGINRGRRIIDSILALKNLRKGGNKANDSLQRFSDRLAKLDGIFGSKGYDKKTNTTPDIKPSKVNDNTPFNPSLGEF